MISMLPFFKIVCAKSFGMPAYLIFFVTNRCNARCGHCFYQGSLNQALGLELSLDEIEKISLNAGRPFTINLTGGEPFLREDLDKIAKLFYSNASVRTIGIPTNGLLTDKIIKTVKSILSNCPGIVLNVTVSLDALGKAHDDLRGVSGLFEASCRTIAGLKGLKNKQLNVGACITLSARNQGSAIETYRYTKNEIKPDFISLLLLRGNLPNPELKKVDSKIYQDIAMEMEADFKENSLRSILSRLIAGRDILSRKAILNSLNGSQNAKLSCFAGILTGVINERGEVFACEPLNLKMGSLREHGYNLKKIWKSKDAEQIRAHIKKTRCFCTHECFLSNNILLNKSYWLRLAKQLFKKPKENFL